MLKSFLERLRTRRAAKQAETLARRVNAERRLVRANLRLAEEQAALDRRTATTTRPRRNEIIIDIEEQTP
jgi:hypothetical protein